jgi:NAD(P)H dehydrogenase (quinone)
VAQRHDLSNRALRCDSCGALWISEPAQRLIERSQTCLRCGGELLAGEEIPEDSGARRALLAVTEAAGELGKRVAARLTEHGVVHRLLVADRAQPPQVSGIDVIHASYDDPARMRRALTGVHTLAMVSARESADLVEENAAMVDAAVEAGVERIVYLSLLSAAPDATYLFARDQFRTEEHARATGLPCTFLRPSPYIDLIPLLCTADGVIKNPAGDGRVACVTRDDVAAVAAGVLTTRDHDNRTYDVTGAESQTMADIAAELAQVTGRYITYEKQTLEDARSALAARGAHDREIESWATGFSAIANGEMDVASDTVARLTGHGPETLAQYLRRHPESYEHIATG